MFQQNSYRNERYRRWRAEHRKQEAWWRFWHSFMRQSAKKPLVMTSRAKRLYITALMLVFLLLLVIELLVFLPIPILIKLALATLYLVVYVFSGYYLMFINWLLQPIEKSINHKYLREAKEILAGRPGLQRVAITGSYGKTSCKMILTAMLGEKYITLATPESVNTPMGITRIIREQLKPIHEIFICEMGAKQAGDIAELCELVQPQTGILTAIGPQHLATFGSEEIIANTKFELIRALPPEGLAVLNLDYEAIFSRKEEAPCQIVAYGLKAEQHYHAEEIRYSAEGVVFTLVSPRGERQLITSRLLGRHNIENILGAAAVAAELGLSLSQIARAVGSLNPLPHRLQLLSGPGYTIIDDAFNSNPQGAAAALEVLAHMGEGHKILITPGMVELGEKERELNREFAIAAAAICDYIILVGKKHSQPLQEGLREASFAADKYWVAANLSQARQILAQIVTPCATVLFENDLPDIYNE
ncbi:MAG: UDP-N-acetylmuramoyl-tripeptide--D-alanyl-D-alanine ligase [Clostridiales bacterium]|nr:UDP-N-acetylmuramoyl-tripeptide--D-alanyl-D-alanine ligase [Clostridiales bacterium]